MKKTGRRRRRKKEEEDSEHDEERPGEEEVWSRKRNFISFTKRTTYRAFPPSFILQSIFKSSMTLF